MDKTVIGKLAILVFTCSTVFALDVEQLTKDTQKQQVQIVEDRTILVNRLEKQMGSKFDETVANSPILDILLSNAKRANPDLDSTQWYILRQAFFEVVTKHMKIKMHDMIVEFSNEFTDAQLIELLTILDNPVYKKFDMLIQSPERKMWMTNNAKKTVQELPNLLNEVLIKNGFNPFVINEKDDWKKKNFILSQSISAMIKSNINYPTSVRKSGIEGDVFVKFKLCKNGEVKDITVSGSNEILNDATMKTVEKLKDKFQVPSEDLIIQFPIEYRLK